jgi:hypothetical protein
MTDIRDERRFKTVHKPKPDIMWGLSKDHPAMIEKRPLFQNRISRARDTASSLLVSGGNNRKIGNMVSKGAWRGFPIYTLTLAERTTCPAHCPIMRECYGNGMQWPRRLLPGSDLTNGLKIELYRLDKKHPGGFVVRLHVLGDFYSPEYVAFWHNMLIDYPALHIYGYTAHRLDAPDPRNALIGYAIADLKAEFPERFVIRWSHTVPGPDRAVVIDYIPSENTVAEGLVCPAETTKAASCASCGLCWEGNFRHKSIVFIKHGPYSGRKQKSA